MAGQLAVVQRVASSIPARNCLAGTGLLELVFWLGSENYGFYGYGFFPEYPYEIEGGTILVVRGDYPTIEEKQELDEKTLKETKGKTKEQMKEERARLKEEQKMKAQLAKETKRKEDENMVKARCNPFSDPGYQIQESAALPSVNEALIGYRAAWSLFDELPKEKFGETIYGYMKPLLTEDLMKSMHLECRKVIDEMMRLDLKLLIQKHQADFKSMGRKFPKIKPRKKPKAPPVPKPIIYDKKLIKQTAPVFDLNLVTKPTVKLSDVFGDLNYAAYNFNIRDPNATFPFPAYGDIKDRLRLSCVLGCGIQDGATRRKSVMLLGPERNGKQFLVDAVAGELNAIKIDITPEVFTAIVHKPLKVLTQVFLTAKAFQPTVIFMKNVERVFATKVPPEDKYLKAQSLKTALAKQIKQISADDKIIFIGTCSNPWAARAKPMMNIFEEILIVPRTDYGTLSQFLQTKLLNIRSIPRDYCVQSMAQVLRGYSFGDIITAFEEVMTPERLVRLNVTPLSPGEILEVLLQKGLEPMDVVDFQKYVDFSIQYGPLKTERENYAKINLFREDFYKKEAKKKGEKEKGAAANT
uniref:SFRICE_016071 n=1 Tax=Spodoptera frugiperda TaxID=7108 RepID=A0A2H1W7X0_SPOFR